MLSAMLILGGISTAVTSLLIAVSIMTSARSHSGKQS